jgi:Flp pilus assembly pilin Flp
LICGSGKVSVAEKFKRWQRDEDGATAIEYALIAAAMGTALVPAIATTASGVGILYTFIGDLFSHPAVSF